MDYRGVSALICKRDALRDEGRYIFDGMGNDICRLDSQTREHSNRRAVLHITINYYNASHRCSASRVQGKVVLFQRDGIQFSVVAACESRS
jgi:hypothetical protein